MSQPAEVLHPVRGGRELGEQPLVQLGLPCAASRRAASAACAVERGPQRRARDLELGRDRRARRELRLLRQAGDERPAAELDRAAVRLGDAGEEPHERRLPRAVHADEADPLALLDREGEPVEDGPAPEGEAEAGGVEERHAGPFIAPGPAALPPVW